MTWTLIFGDKIVIKRKPPHRRQRPRDHRATATVIAVLQLMSDCRGHESQCECKRHGIDHVEKRNALAFADLQQRSMDFSPSVLLAQQRSGAVSYPPWSIHSDGRSQEKLDWKGSRHEDARQPLLQMLERTRPIFNINFGSRLWVPQYR